MLDVLAVTLSNHVAPTPLILSGDSKLHLQIHLGNAPCILPRSLLEAPFPPVVQGQEQSELGHKSKAPAPTISTNDCAEQLLSRAVYEEIW